MTIGLPHARTVVRVDRSRQPKGKPAPREEPETACLIASQDAGERTPAEWARLVRNHWGVENANHWRRDATLLEDLKTYRGKQRNIGAAFLLGRSVLLAFNADWGDGNLNALLEELRAEPTAIWSLAVRGTTKCKRIPKRSSLPNPPVK